MIGPNCLCPGRRQGMRRCSLLAALLYCLTAGQIALFVLALWQNGWQIEALAHNPLVRAETAVVPLLAPSSVAAFLLSQIEQQARHCAAEMLFALQSVRCSTSACNNSGGWCRWGRRSGRCRQWGCCQRHPWWTSASTGAWSPPSSCAPVRCHAVHGFPAHCCSAMVSCCLFLCNERVKACFLQQACRATEQRSLGGFAGHQCGHAPEGRSWASCAATPSGACAGTYADDCQPCKKPLIPPAVPAAAQA